MQKLRLFLLLFFIPFTLLAQQGSKIILVDAKTGTLVPGKDVTYLSKPVFKHDNAILTCDSAVFYTVRNVFEAYRNVHINQADTVNIFSERLTYDGNTKMAHLSDNVRLLDRESVLTTNILDYNMATKVGTYVQGGKIVNKDVTLTSKNGYYFSNSRDAYFRYDVLVVTPSSTIKSDTLRYNTFTNWTYFYGPTNIKGKDDNLYTENGAYNTRSENAYFGRRNLYTQGSKSLKGDSLYYDGKRGYGKAVRNIVFKDTVDNIVLYGQLGEYYKDDQRAVITKKPYVGYGTTDSVEVAGVKNPDTLWLGADTLVTQMVLQKTLKLIPTPELKNAKELESAESPGNLTAKEEKIKPRTNAAQGANENSAASARNTARLSRKEERKNANKAAVAAANPPPAVIPDSLKISSQVKADIPKDSLLTQMPRVVSIDSSKLKAKDSLSRVVSAADTIRTRIIKAYHNVKVYKSNMQARADSLFYTNADSTFRWFKNPMLWAQGSQQTGDTIYLQLKNKKLNTVQVIQKAFIVNVETDSTKFNQVKGKVITGFFTEGKLNSMYVDGNAESIYYFKNDSNVYERMNQTVSSRIKVLFKNNEMSDVVPTRNVDGEMYSMEEIPKDAILTGFIWKPELRPLSKEEVTGVKSKPSPKLKVTPKPKTTPDKPVAKTAVKKPLAAQRK